jgi:hypothetical protein
VNDLPLIYWAITTLISGFLVSLTAYFTKKGENRAMREDIKDLTRMAKEIEAKISNEMWDRQKRWELRRDAAFEAVKELATVQQSLKMVLSAHQVLGHDPQNDSHIGRSWRSITKQPRRSCGRRCWRQSLAGRK